jgi:16S rRNA (uracil1498-N3)-methyltransferase
MALPKRRLHVAVQLNSDASLTLDPERSHYLCRVLRQRRGDRVLLFCGDGDGYEAQLRSADARACEVDVGAVIATEPAPRLRLHLAQAMIKGDRLDFVLQKATELGVTDIWLVETQHTEVHIEGPRIARRETHWQRIVESAAEQCGRLRLPSLHAPVALRDLLRASPAKRLLLLDPGAAPIDGEAPDDDTLLLVGPEGGFSDEERAAAHAIGARSMGLGRLILRADTAPIAALAVLRNAWGWNAP